MIIYPFWALLEFDWALWAEHTDLQQLIF